MTVMRLSNAFVIISTGRSRSKSVATVASIASALVRSVVVGAGCVNVTVVCVKVTFIVVGAGDSITVVTGVTGAFKRSNIVGACRIGIAVVGFISAFIVVGTGNAVSTESGDTGTLE
jgi:hypothetical protein